MNRFLLLVATLTIFLMGWNHARGGQDVTDSIPWVDANWTHNLEITDMPVSDAVEPRHLVGARPIPVLDVFRVLYAGRAEIVLCILLILSGLWLLRVFRRRHLVAGQPHCRRCLYQVSDVIDEVCPECGHPLTRWRATLTVRNPRVHLGVASFFLLAVLVNYIGWGNSLPRKVIPGHDLPRWSSRYAASLTERFNLTSLDDFKSLHTEVVVVDVVTGATTQVVRRVSGTGGRAYRNDDGEKLTVLSRSGPDARTLRVHELSRSAGTVSFQQDLEESYTREFVGATEAHIIVTDRSRSKLWHFDRTSGEVAATVNMDGFGTGPFPHAEPHGVVLHGDRFWRGLLTRSEGSGVMHSWPVSDPALLETTPIHGRYAPRPAPVGSILYVIAVQDTSLWVYPWDDPFRGRRVYTARDQPNYRGGSLLGPEGNYVVAWHLSRVQSFADVFERGAGTHVARIGLSFPRYRSDAIVTEDGRYLVMPQEGVRPIVIDVYDLENLKVRTDG